MKLKYITDLGQIPGIPEADRATLTAVAAKYAFRVNDYYLGLIDWTDPADPIRQLVIPRTEELAEWGALDASNEQANTPVRGVQHKYRDTVLLLCNEVCGAYCRYCFRKRLFMNDNDEVSLDVSEGLEYIRAHPEVTNVLLTGGDPLLLSTRRLTEILEELSTIPHVRIIRLGSKMPAFNPWRLLDDEPLQATLRAINSRKRPRIYLMAHFDHPRELTEPAREGIRLFQQLGCVTVNQCPLIRGINDDPLVLRTLMREMAWLGAPQYYLFQGRPTAGNEPYELPLVASYQLFEEARRPLSGLEKRARFCMSHEAGKIEVVGLDQEHIYLRFHRAKVAADANRFLIARRDDKAYWFDQLEILHGLEPAKVHRRNPSVRSVHAAGHHGHATPHRSRSASRRIQEP